MTTNTRRPRRPVTAYGASRYINRDHTIIGTRAQLTNIVANHRTAGTFAGMSAPRPVPGNRYQVVLRLREYQPTPPTVRVTSVGEHARTRVRRSRRTRLAVIATTITGTIAGLVAAVVYLIGQLVEFIAAHAAHIVGALIVIAILAALASRGPSGRRHCPGC